MNAKIGILLQSPKIDKKASSILFGYLGFNNYGDELLAASCVKKYELESTSQLSRKTSFWGHLKSLMSSKQIIALGGLFQDETSLWSLFYYCFVLKFFKIFGKKVFLVAVGVGPIKSEISRFIVFVCLVGIKNISVRDEYSKKLLASMGIEAEMENDLAWVNKGLITKASPIEKTLICVRNYNDWLLMKERFVFDKFDLFLMQKEFDLAEVIRSETAFGVDVIDAFAFELNDLLYKISSYNKLITSRYHGAILGFLAKTDVKILEVNPKLSSLLNTIAQA